MPDPLPSGASPVTLLGLGYAHCNTADGGDLYVLAEALPFWAHLQPENWFERAWFESRRVRLPGTSAVYRVPTKPVQGSAIDLVVKFSRVGQHVPLETRVLYEVLQAEFNGPFEEFGLVEEMRASPRATRDGSIRCQSPLAVYVPPERLQLWQTGRSEAKIAAKIERHPGVTIDILRDYIVVYRWLDGSDAAEAFRHQRLNRQDLEALTARATADLATRGFRVLDMKPEHLILRFEAGGCIPRRDGGGEVELGLVDFELLERTPEYEAEVKARRRSEYRRHTEGTSSDAPAPTSLPPHLESLLILGVGYIVGHVESTAGTLWVRGNDAVLFDYFLPERWRQTHHEPLHAEHECYYTVTKDNLPVVWKVSRVGEPQDLECEDAADRRALAHGVNSPFEEFALAEIIARNGIGTVTPYAIYMTGHQSRLEDRTLDWRRYRTHERFRLRDGSSILRSGRDYIMIWSYGAADLHAGAVMSGSEARTRGLVESDELAGGLADLSSRVEATGIEVMRLLPRQVLVATDAAGAPVRDDGGRLVLRLCSFDHFKLPRELEIAAEGIVPDFVPPGIAADPDGSTRGVLHRLLTVHQEALVGATMQRIRASGAPHYASTGETEMQRRVISLVNAMVEATRHDWRTFVHYIGGISRKRIEEGFHLGEIQMALGCFEEAIWECCTAEIEERGDLVRCLHMVSGMIGQAKDELARLYVELSPGLTR